MRNHPLRKLFGLSPVVIAGIALAGMAMPVRGAGFTVLTDFPQTNGDVDALVVDPANKVVYIGGNFTTVGGKSRNHIAAINAATGAVLDWNPNADNIVFALVLSGTTLYAGGDFTVIGGQARKFLAALDTTTGDATMWNPNPDDGVTALATDDTYIYASGFFTKAGGQNYQGLTKLAISDGTAQAGWNPNPTVYSANLMTDVGIGALGLSVAGTKLYARGIFDKIGGQARYSVAQLNISDGTATAWNPNATQGQLIYALGVSNDTVYLGGTFSTMGGQSRNNIAAVNTTDGSATSWDPNADGIGQAFTFDGSTVYVGGGFTHVGGQARSHLAALDASTGDATEWNPGASSIYVMGVMPGSTIFLGGNPFSQVGGVARTNFAAVTENAVPPVSSSAPVVKISGKKSVTTSQSALTIKGTATVADGSVAVVKVKVGKAGAKSAKGTANWSFKAKLAPGRNVIVVTATGSNGLTSQAVKISVTRR